MAVCEEEGERGQLANFYRKMVVAGGTQYSNGKYRGGGNKTDLRKNHESQD